MEYRMLKTAFKSQMPKMQRYLLEEDMWARMTIGELMFPDRKMRNRVKKSKRRFAIKY